MAEATDHWDFHFDYAGRSGGKASEQERVLREKVMEEEHVHLLSRTLTKCWNGDDTCPTWQRQGGVNAD